jgi:hypothetical protein
LGLCFFVSLATQREKEVIMTSRFTNTFLLGAGLLLAGTPLEAQDPHWAEAMFDKREHDFGVVARGTDARFRWTITNRNSQTVHIAGVTTTCGCTAARPEKETLAPRESTYVEITMNTVKFEGHKPSSVTVEFDRPGHAEVRLAIHAFIRRDVVMTPGGARFGSISRGAESEQTIDVAYAGRGDWKVKEVLSKNPHIDAQVVETRRNASNVNYKLHVTVKDGMPVGEFREQLTLVTDEPTNPFIPLLVEGRVEAEFTVTPEIVSFGNLAPGERKTVSVVIRGRKPFAIEKIESRESADAFEVRLPKDEKSIQIVQLAVIAPNQPGPLDEDFTVTIREHPERLTFKAHGKIVATTATSAATGARTPETANRHP